MPQPRLPTLAALDASVIACERCPRLRLHCQTIGQVRKREFAGEGYWARPVPSFGDPAARLLIVGLAPAAHGANRTGQLFTGDSSGSWLYEALHRYGWSNRPNALSRGDGLVLTDCRITAAAHCAPPDNKPTGEELANSLRPSPLRPQPPHPTPRRHHSGHLIPPQPPEHQHRPPHPRDVARRLRPDPHPPACNSCSPVIPASPACPPASQG